MHLENKERFDEFWGSLKEIGVQHTSWVEAVQYSGKPIEVRFKLSVKHNFFSRSHLAASIDEESLITLRSYINHHQDYKNWKIYTAECENTVKSGDYMIVERSALKGGSREEIANIVKRFGGNQEDINYFLDKTEDKILGYVLPNSYLSAHELAKVVQVGGFETLCTPEEHQELVKGILRWAETHCVKSREEIFLERIIYKQYKRGLSNTRIHELLEEYSNMEILCESLIKKLEDSVIDDAFNIIDSSNDLTADEKAVTDFELLTILEGGMPTSRGLSCLERVMGKEFVKAILDKKTEL